MITPATYTMLSARITNLTNSKKFNLIKKNLLHTYRDDDRDLAIIISGFIFMTKQHHLMKSTDWTTQVSSLIDEDDFGFRVAIWILAQCNDQNSALDYGENLAETATEQMYLAWMDALKVLYDASKITVVDWLADQLAN